MRITASQPKVKNSPAHMSPLDREIAVTIFASKEATEKFEQVTTLRRMVGDLRDTREPTKSALPWLKCARFGNQRTAHGSLRHNANLSTITGVECDYDAEVVSIDDAVKKLREAGLAALVYTSPSHLPEKPRWRVLCPLSREMEPESRTKLLNRLNGVLGGILASESWTLSQSYYFGFTGDGAHHRVELVDGDFIDARVDLDEGAIEKPIGKPIGKATGATLDPAALGTDAAFSARVQAVLSGASYHAALRDLAASLVRQGVRAVNAADILRHLMDAVTAPHDERWQARYEDIDRLVQSARDNFGADNEECADLTAIARRLRDDPSIENEIVDRVLEALASKPALADEVIVRTTRAEDEFWAEPDPANRDTLAGFLAFESWMARDIPPPDRLLGDLLTITTKAFLCGRTGLGKTLFSMQVAVAVATGTGFLHWGSARPGRVLIIDGEMPAELIKQRLTDAARRAGVAIPPASLFVFARDLEEQFAARFPSLGRFAPLNTPAGQKFVLSLIERLGGVDLIICDNVMSLISGDQKDEVPWSETLPLVAALTSRRVGQLWLDHTGHATERQYGSSTKSWRFDTVAMLLPTDEAPLPGAVSMALNFEHPGGKTRRRTPENWRDYQSGRVRLNGDCWTWEPAEVGAGGKGAGVKAPPAEAQRFFEILQEAVAAYPVLGKPRTTTREHWYEQAVRRGALEPSSKSDKPAEKDRRRARFRKHLNLLSLAQWISVEGEEVSIIKDRHLGPEDEFTAETVTSKAVH